MHGFGILGFSDILESERLVVALCTLKRLDITIFGMIVCMHRSSKTNSDMPSACKPINFHKRFFFSKRQTYETNSSWLHGRCTLFCTIWLTFSFKCFISSKDLTIIFYLLLIAKHLPGLQSAKMYMYTNMHT